MINVIQNGNLYEVSFKYDKNIIYHVKNVSGRRWNPDRKIWTIPKERLGFLLQEFKNTSYEAQIRIVSNEKIGVNESFDTTKEIPNIDISKLKTYVKNGNKLYSHQLDFLKYAIDRQNKGNFSGFLIADEQGLGKTIELMNLALINKKQYKYKHCLIICCINSSKLNWKKEIEDHTNGKETAYILGSRYRRDKKSIRTDTGGKEKYEDLKSGYMFGNKEYGKLPYFLILNIESLRYKDGRSNVITDKIVEMCNSGKINMIAIDEIHKNASPTSQQGKQLLKIKRETGRKVMWMPMTGTPITNKPTDVFLPLKLTDSHSFSSFYKWCQQFCIYGGFGGYEIVGYKNIDKLKEILQDNMIRRLKSDVLDLPPKLYYTEYVENTPYQQKLYAVVTNQIIKERDDILVSLNPMTKLLRLRQVNGNPELIDSTLEVKGLDYIKKNAKLYRLLELLEEIHERGEKVVIFSNWVESLRTLYKFISKKYNVACFTGTMNLSDRESNKNRFINDDKCTVMIGTVGALGTAQTLTVAKNVIFYDEPWTPSDKEQAEDRCHRIGTKDSVNIYTIITTDTVDERVNNILYSKRSVSKYIVDNNKLDLMKNPELFDYLIGG